MPQLIVCILAITAFLLLFWKVALFTVPAFLLVAGVTLVGVSIKAKGR